MVNHKLHFCIDTTFIFENTQKAFLGAPLFTKDSSNTTFLYGFIRDFLRLRQSLGINSGILVIGKEAGYVAPKDNVHNVINFLKEIGLPYIHNPNHSIVRICSHLSKRISYIVSQDRKVLQIANDNISIIFPNNLKDIDCMSPKSIKSEIGVEPKYIPTFLSLTEGAKSSKLTKLQAIRLIELYSDLDNIFDNLSKITPTIKKKLTQNKESLISKYFDIKLQDNHEQVPSSFEDWNIRLSDVKIVSILNSYRFYSLTRLLKNPPQVQLNIKSDKSKPSLYHPIVDFEGLKELEKLLLLSKLCAIDTETDNKDPRYATLFGVSFCVKNGEAYFVSLIEEDLKDITYDDVVSFLRMIANKPIKYIGHNIKYDYLVLRKSGIDIENICFDTMLAAYDCFGDWTFFNLKYLSLKLLGKEIKSYREIVDKSKTFLDLPFKKIVNHGCEDADITLQLYHILHEELEKRGILEQYFIDTLPMIKKLGDMEFDGILLKISSLEELRKDIVSKSLESKHMIYDKVGMKFEIDSQKELAIILKESFGLQQFVSAKKITLALLRQLSINTPPLKIIVKYKILQGHLNQIDSILRQVKDNQQFPLSAKRPNISVS